MQLVAVIHWCQFHRRRFTVDDGVESVDRISGVLDGARRSVGLHQTVAALHNTTFPCLMLLLRVACQSVLDAVGKTVLRIGVGVHVG